MEATREGKGKSKKPMLYFDFTFLDTVRVLLVEGEGEETATIYVKKSLLIGSTVQ